MSEALNGRSNVEQVLAQNIGKPAWFAGGILEIRDRADSVIEALQGRTVVLNFPKQGGRSTIELDNLIAVALRIGIPGSDLGTPISGDDGVGADLVIVSNRPMEEVLNRIRNNAPYLWRSAKTHEMAQRITVSSVLMTATQGDSAAQAAREVVNLAQEILALEPSAGDPMFFYAYAFALGKLQRIEETIEPYERARQLFHASGSFPENIASTVNRQLGLALGVKGLREDDRNVCKRALQHLDEAALADRDPATELRDMLRRTVGG